MFLWWLLIQLMYDEFFHEFFFPLIFFGLVEDIFSKNISYYHINPLLEVFLWPLPGNAAPGCEVSLLPVFLPAAVGFPCSCSLGEKKSSIKVESVGGSW